MERALGNLSFLIITLDSCRWDSFQAAFTPTLDTVVKVVKATAHATFTYPAHHAIFQGILPHSTEKKAFYNRYISQLIKIGRPKAPKSSALIQFPPNTKNIICGFANHGYRTLGWGAVGWFRNSDLSLPFEKFTYTGIHARRQADEFISTINKIGGPFFSLINFGETHYPYRFSSRRICEPTLSPARRSLSSEYTFDYSGWKAQVKSCEFLDNVLESIIVYLQDQRIPTCIVVTADHGECFGEDGLFGHGFYHRFIMEVPLGIFELNSTFLIDHTSGIYQ